MFSSFTKLQTKLNIPKRTVLKTKNLSPSRFPSMTIPFPGIPAPDYSRPLAPPLNRLTTLPNGIRVVSEDHYSQISSLNLFVTAGSRFEPPSKPGLVHLLHRMFFMSTKNRTEAQMINDTEDIGANMLCHEEKDFFYFALNSLRHSFNRAMDIFGDAIQNPLFSEEAIQEQVQAIQIEQAGNLDDYSSKIYHYFHKVAYHGDPIGNSILFNFPDIEKITQQDLLDFYKKSFKGPNIVVSASSVDHDTLVKLVNTHFGSLPKGESSEPMTYISNYTGGFMYEELSPTYMEKENFVEYVMVGFKGTGWLQQKESFALAILSKILGGGPSFSAGGPGKGMFSRLYSRLMNEFQWVEYAECQHLTYMETGLFTIQAACKPGNLVDLLEKVCAQFWYLVEDSTEKPAQFKEELERAKNLLKSKVFSVLEHRSVFSDDMGRQVIVYGHYQTVEEVFQKIDEITVEYCTTVLLNLLQEKPTLVILGTKEGIASLPSYQNVCQYFKIRDY